MEETALRVGVYARISLDRDGQQTATARQMQDAHEFAARRDWVIADVFEDIDLSAFDLSKKRPEFERMLATLVNGEIDGVLVWKFDRLTRQQRDLARVLEACAPHKGFIASVTEPIDTREPHGQFVAELLVAQARMESANTSARQRRKAQEQREQGLPPTNGKRCFGYDQRYTRVMEDEVAIIREARDRLFAGESLRSICMDLNERGVRSTDGNGVRDHIFKRLLVSPTIAAERELAGKRYPGNWPAIITPAESRQLGVLLNKRTLKRESPARRYLLTGLIRCANCGGRMRAHAKADGYRRYVCTRSPGYPNCGSMSIVATPVEELVREMIVAAVNDERLREQVLSDGTVDQGLVESIRADERALEELATDYYVERAITREEFAVAREALNGRIEGLRLRLARQSQSRVLGDIVSRPHAIDQVWETAGLDWRRSVIAALIDHVSIRAGEPGRRPFDPNRVRPVWRI
ncbi:MAG: recombinase family protein [Dehalococcoidia bacterium]|nr:recombinase family protein [Dehalococcoidia bacterium]